MRVHHAGKQPHEQFAMVPNATARDSSLTFRARGVLAFLLSHKEGWEITNVDRIADEGVEGREATRTVVRELEAAGYIRRYQTRDEAGQMVGHLDLYPYGDAPQTGNQSSGARSPGFRSPGSRAPIEEDQEEDSLTSPPVVTSPKEEPPKSEPDMHVGCFPTVAARRLATLGITDLTSWEEAWVHAHHVNAEPGVDLPPEEHLSGYLQDCKARRFTPNAWKWEGFYRQRRLAETTAHEQQVATIQRRDDWDQFERSYNNRLKPRAWGLPREEAQS